MKLNNLKFYLTGAGSTLEILPNSDPDDELHRICEIARGYTDVYATALKPELREQIAACRNARVHIEHFYPKTDRDSILDDWKAVGADLIIATQEAKKSLHRLRKDESECWSS